MVSFEDDDDPAGSGAESQDEDDNDELEDDNDGQDANDDDGQDGEDDGDNDEDGDDNDDDDEDQDDTESPSQAQARRQNRAQDQSPSRRGTNPTVLLTSPSPHPSGSRSPSNKLSYVPNVRPEAVTANVYDIVPTMAAPQGTSINAVTATADMRWVFSGGSDGYIRMFNWVDTANGKVPLTVAQKHPFVDSVMKAGALTTYWENEESVDNTPKTPGDDSKDLSPVYSLAVQHQAIWLMSGLESGAINIQTCRHQAGTRVATLRQHTSAVSVLKLGLDEVSALSGSWDKSIHDWDLNTGKVKRSFLGSGSQISAIEVRPQSSLAVPEITDDTQEDRGTFSSNNGSKALLNGVNGTSRAGSRVAENGMDDALGSPDGSLFGDNDHGSLFGDDGDTGGGGGNFGDDDDNEFSKAIANELQNGDGEEGVTNEPSQLDDTTTVQDADVTMADADTTVDGVQNTSTLSAPIDSSTAEDTSMMDAIPQVDGASSALPHSEDPIPNGTHVANDTQPLQSESTFLDAAIDGTIRIWDRRIQSPVAQIYPTRSTPPWCMGACWSPDGNSFFAGRRNGTVEEYNLHKGSRMSEPSRVFRFPTGSGAVTAVRSMPNSRHLVCASYDILRLYDLREHEIHAQQKQKHSAVPFLIVPGHRTGVISALHIDPTCRFMISTAGNRGWEGSSTEVLLGYEIGIPS